MRERERESNKTRGGTTLGLGGTMAPLIFFKYIYICVCINFSNFVL